MAKSAENQYPIPAEIELILSLVKSSAIRNAASRVPPHLWDLPIEQLEAHLAPTESARAIRAAFWNEIGGAIILGQPVKLLRLANEASLSYDHSHDLLTRDPAMLPWLMYPLRNSVEANQLKSEALRKIDEIVRLPIKDKRGRPIVRNAKLILQVIEVLWSISKK